MSVAVQKGNTELKEHLNTVLAELEEDGSLDEFIKIATELADSNKQA